MGQKQSTLSSPSSLQLSSYYILGSLPPPSFNNFLRYKISVSLELSKLVLSANSAPCLIICSRIFCISASRIRISSCNARISCSCLSTVSFSEACSASLVFVIMLRLFCRLSRSSLRTDISSVSC